MLVAANWLWHALSVDEFIELILDGKNLVIGLSIAQLAILINRLEHDGHLVAAIWSLQLKQVFRVRAQLLDLHRDELTRREVSIAELVLGHLWEHLVVKLNEEKELAGGHFVLRRRERELNLHDVAL